MDESTVLDIGRQALTLITLLSAPLLLAALLVGLVIGVFQAATQIQEQTLSFIPKLLGLMVALVAAGPWMLRMWISFTRQLFESIPGLIG